MALSDSAHQSAVETFSGRYCYQTQLTYLEGAAYAAYDTSAAYAAYAASDRSSDGVSCRAGDQTVYRD